MTHSQRCKFYIASCDKDGGIYLCEYRNGNALVLEKMLLDRPMYMAEDAGRLHIILRQPFEGKNNSGVISFDIEGGKLKNPSEIISTGGVVACHLCVLDGKIYCANYLSGSITKLPDTVVSHTGSGINPKRQEMPHTHYINSFDNKYLLCCDLGTDEIYTYDKDLNEVSRACVPQGHGVRHLEYANGCIYCANELESTVSVFDYNDGVLTYKATVKTLPEDFTGESTAAAIRVKDNFLYVSNRGHDSISVFELCNKIPILKACVNCGGNSPRDFNIFDNLLVCTNENSDNVTFFDVTNGVPVRIDAELKIKAPLCVIKR